MKRVLLCFALCAIVFAACEGDNNDTKSQFSVTFGGIECATTDTTATITTSRPVVMVNDTNYIVSDSDLYLVYKEAGRGEEQYLTEVESEGDTLCFTLTELKPETEYTATLWHNAGMRGMFQCNVFTFSTLTVKIDVIDEMDYKTTGECYANPISLNSYANIHSRKSLTIR